MDLVAGSLSPATAAEAVLAAAPPVDARDWSGRVEIDTSAPFESVREAVDRFGGAALWKSQLRQLFSPAEQSCNEINPDELEEQTSNLEKDLIMKERETLEVLKELEMAKRRVDELKLQIQREVSKSFATTPEKSLDCRKVHPILESEEKVTENLETSAFSAGTSTSTSTPAMHSPSMVLTELKKAKVNLGKATSDLAGIRASVNTLSSKIEKEKSLLEKTREKLKSNTAKVVSLEEDINRTTLQLDLIRKAEDDALADPNDISRKIKEITLMIEQYQSMSETGRSEISKLNAEIERTKASIKTSEIKWVAAKKMEEAAKAVEAATVSEIKALMSSDDSSNECLESSSRVSVPIEEYILLTRKAEEADKMSKSKIQEAMLQVDEANETKRDLLMKVEEAREEVRTSKKVLEEALRRVESANEGKLAVEEALRKWRSERGGQRRRSVHNGAKFKNSAHHRRGSSSSRMFSAPDASLLPNKSVGSATTIGQILSRKLMGPETVSSYQDTEVLLKSNAKSKVSLGQMLMRRRHEALSSSPSPNKDDSSSHKQFPAKRKKFTFAGLSSLSGKENKKIKKKKQNKQD